MQTKESTLETQTQLAVESAALLDGPRHIASVMGFDYNEELPETCLRPDCWMERFIESVEAELALGTYC